MGLFKNFGFNSEKEAKVRAEAEADLLRKQQSNLSNLAKGSQIKFAVPYFDVFDPRFQNFAVPVAVHGTLVYAVDNINEFKAINKTENYNDEAFQQKLKGQITKYVKSVVCNAPVDNNIQVMQLERKIIEISELVQRLVSPKIEQLFAVNIRSLDITQIIVDKDSRGYRELKSVTQEFELQNLQAQQNVNLSNFSLQNQLNQDMLRAQSSLNLDAMRRQQEMQLGGQEEMQRMQLENQRETMRIQREEMQRAAKLQTESNFLNVHQANINAEVAKTQSMFGQQSITPPPMPSMPGGMPQMPGMPPHVQYMVGINGQPMGPFDWNQLQQLVQNGQLTQQSQVWKQGMPAWAMAGQVQELLPLFMV